MNYAPWVTDITKTIGYQESKKEYDIYAMNKSKERKYYRQNFLDKYPGSTTLHSEDLCNIPDMEKFIKLYFNGHNIWYVLDPNNKIIYQYGYGVLGVNQYSNGTAEYQYILDCCSKHKEIDKTIMYDHLFDQNDNYRG